MSDFGRVVQLAKIELATTRSAPEQPTSKPESARWKIAHFARDREEFNARLTAQLHSLEHSVDSFDLSSDIPRTPARRIAVTVFNRLFSVGGLARHLGSTQKRANENTLAALRIIQIHLEEQDRTLAALNELVLEEVAQDNLRRKTGP